MPKLGLGLGLPTTRASKTFDPTNIADLKLWLKADAGVTFTPTEETFISEIEIDNAGTDTSNGTYTRVVGGEATFQGPNGNTIYFSEWNGDPAWVLNDIDFGDDVTYYNTNVLADDGWAVANGDPDAPSAINTTTTVTYNYVDLWEDQSENGNNATPMVGHAPFFLAANESPISKDCVSFYASNSYGSSYDKLTVPGADFDSATNATLFIVARQLVAFPYANGNYFSMEGGRKWQLTSGYMLLHGGNYNGGTNPNIGDSFYHDFPLTLFAVRPNFSNGEAKTTTIFAESWTNDYDNTIAAGRYDYTGELSRGPVIPVGFIGSDAEIGTKGGGENLRGEICEILFYSRSLTDTEFENVVTYLNSKYAIY